MKKPQSDERDGESPPKGDPRFAARYYDMMQSLLKDRIIFLGTPIDDDASEMVITQLLFAAKEDSRAPISLYINSQGGAVLAALSIYDAIRQSKTPIHTYCLGHAHGMAMLLVAAGKRGNRYCLQNAFFQFCPTVGGDALARTIHVFANTKTPRHQEDLKILWDAIGWPSCRTAVWDIGSTFRQSVVFQPHAWPFEKPRKTA